MKKMKFLILVFLMMSIGVINVEAETTANGVKKINPNNNSTTLRCKYSDGTFIEINETDHIEMVTPDPATQNYLPFKTYSYTEMGEQGFIWSGNWDCPLYAISKSEKVIRFDNGLPIGEVGVTWATLEKEESECEGSCIVQESNKKSNYTCNYSGSSGLLKIEGIAGQNKCTVTYPDGRENQIEGCGGWYSSGDNTCVDLFYNKRTDDLKEATFDVNVWYKNANTYNPDLYNFICGKDSDNIEYYCVGSCQYGGNSNINCSKISDTINGVTSAKTNLPKFCKQESVLKSFKFIGNLLFVVKIIVPIILIIMGTIDFAKAIIASRTDVLQKSAKMFAIRIGMGIAIFLLPTVISFIFSIFPSSKNEFKACETCLFHPNKCKISK